MRKLTIFAPVLAFLFFAQFAFGQQGDAMFGGGTLLSSSSASNGSFALEKDACLLRNVGALTWS